ncbi:hypothetical protein KR038_002696 [Drosophila bunnanda]|nr:hypothetical protein KR038_002696 [Drosophila bunnanda]
MESIRNLEHIFSDLNVKVRDLVESTLNQMNDEKKLNPGDVTKTTKDKMNVEIQRNIFQNVRERLEEEKARNSELQAEVQEIRAKLNAFQNRTENIIDDIEYIKMLMQEASNRLDDMELSD